ncbi:MAG: hypothetical protein IKG03_01085 [Clostridiales bacterium]|nr:hypothetical protein [Clostridiales bacterium]
MKVRILYLYPDYMNLYGDNGNVRIMERRLSDQGFDVETVSGTITDSRISIKDVDFVYMGSGFESNRNMAADHLKRSLKELTQAIDDGVPMLFTGNSYDILGKGIITADFSLVEGLGIFDYSFKDTGRKRYTGDVILEDPDTKERYVGFINRAGIPEQSEGFVFDVVKVIGDVPVEKDGVRKNNLLGISLIGPVLVKNPGLADSFVRKICEREGVKYKQVVYPRTERSHEKTLKALLETEI